MRWPAVAAVALAVTLLAVGGAAAEQSATSPPQTVKSKDGGLMVFVPRGALRTPAKVRIRVLTRSHYPPELKNATVRPGTKLYELEPSGLRFLKPVTITRRLDTRVAGFKQNAVQGVVLASRDRSGKWELLSNLRARLNGRTLTVSGQTRHFSTLLTLDEGFSLTLLPREVEAFVGDEWTARVVSEIDNRRRRDPIRVDSDETKWAATGAVERGKAITYLQQVFRCARVGTGTYTAHVTVAEFSLAVFLGSLGGSYDESVVVFGNARCTARTTPSLELIAACVAVTHTPFGSFPSFLRWLLGFRPAGVPANARAELTVAGMNNGQPVIGTIDRSTGRVALQGGISSFGPKQVQRLAVAGQDLTSQLVAKTAAAPVVTAEQGVIVGTCP